MVSTSEIAKQVKLSPAKDGHRYHASHADDAFKQIFADVARLKDAVAEQPKDNGDINDTKALKADALEKAADKKKDCRADKKDCRADKKDDNGDDDHKKPVEAKIVKSDKICTHKKDKVDSKSDADDNDDDKVEAKEDKKDDNTVQQVADTTETDAKDPSTTQTKTADIVDIQGALASDVPCEDTTPNDVQSTQSDQSSQTDQVAQSNTDVRPDQNVLNQALVAQQNSQANDADSVKTDAASTDEKIAVNPQAMEQVKNLTFRAGSTANLDKAGKGIAKLSNMGTVDSEAPIEAPIKASDDAADDKKSDSTKGKDGNFGQLVKAAVADAKEKGLAVHDAVAEVMDDKANVVAQDAKSDRKDAVSEAGEKHKSILEMLQAAPANQTSPAASGRAISEAVQAPGFPAPTPNGTSGGGSPISNASAQVEGAAQTAQPVSGLEGVHAQKGVEQGNFTNLVRGSKEQTAAPVMPPSEQVAVHISRMVKNGNDRYELQLHPADLGRVDVRIEINREGLVVATVTADNQQTFDMLQKDQRSLERALNQAGLQTDSNSLNFNLRGGDSQHAQQQAQHGQGNPWSKWMDKTLPENEVTSKVINFDVANTSGRVNLMV